MFERTLSDGGTSLTKFCPMMGIFCAQNQYVFPSYNFQFSAYLHDVPAYSWYIREEEECEESGNTSKSSKSHSTVISLSALQSTKLPPIQPMYQSRRKINSTYSLETLVKFQPWVFMLTLYLLFVSCNGRRAGTRIYLGP